MRIVFLTAEYPPQAGGIGDYTHCLARTLAERGHDLFVITGPAPHVEIEPGSTTPASPCVWRQIDAWNWHCWRDTIAALDNIRPDILHIQYQTGAYQMHPAINLLPWRLRTLPEHPSIAVTFHDLLEPYLFPKASILRRLVTMRLARDAHSVIATNSEDQQTLRARLPANQQVHMVPIGSNIPVAPPPGYERSQWRASLGISPEEVIVAYFGLLSRSKGLDLLIEALDQLAAGPAAGPPLRLLIIGGTAAAAHDQAYAAEIMAALEHPTRQKKIIHSGHVDAATVSAHLLASDIVALPFRAGASFRSGSLLAALSHGAAVITTTSQHPRTRKRASNKRPPTWMQLPGPHLVDDANALLIPANDSTALAAALQRLIGEQDTRARLSRGAKALAAHFNWDAIAYWHEQIYQALRPDTAAGRTMPTTRQL